MTCAHIIRNNVSFFEAIPGGRGPWTPLHPYQGSTPPCAFVSVSIPGYNGSEKEFKPEDFTEMLTWGKSGRRLKFDKKYTKTWGFRKKVGFHGSSVVGKREAFSL